MEKLKLGEMVVCIKRLLRERPYLKCRLDFQGMYNRRKIEVKRAIRDEKVRREKMQAREKVGKSRNTVFFQCFVAPEGRTVGLLKRRVRSHLGR